MHHEVGSVSEDSGSSKVAATKFFTTSKHLTEKLVFQSSSPTIFEEQPLAFLNFRGVLSGFFLKIWSSQPWYFYQKLPFLNLLEMNPKVQSLLGCLESSFYPHSGKLQNLIIAQTWRRNRNHHLLSMGSHIPKNSIESILGYVSNSKPLKILYR